MFAQSIKTGQLLVAVTAAVTNPTGVLIGRATLSVLGQINDTLTARTPALARLAAEIDRDFKRALAAPSYDKPADLRLLLPQMLETAVARIEFAGHGLDAGRILDDLVAGLDSPDIRPEHIRAFRRLLAPILGRICDDPRLKQAVDPALTRLQMQRQQEQSSQIEAILARLGGIEQALDAPRSLPQTDLAALVARFGGDPRADPAAMIGFLNDKAEDYRAYRDQIGGLDDRVGEVAALKSAARAAAERLDFDAVEDLLAEVSATEAALLAETSLARARNALLRGRDSQAATLLTAAADAFAVVDPAEPPRRRNAHAGLLVGHALRYGGDGLALAARMLEGALAQAETAAAADTAAAIRQNLAIALHNRGRSLAGAEGTALIDRAIALLTGVCDATPPDSADWGAAQQNLGAALHTLAGRSGDNEAAALFTRAIAAFEAALSVAMPADDPEDWSRLQQNLAVALKSAAERQSGPDAAALLIRSTAAFESALAAISRDTAAEDWATIQLNLGNARTTEAERREGPAAGDLLDRAIASYHAALGVFAATDHPADHALTQLNLGNALGFRAAIGPADEAPALFEAAQAAYDTALAFFSRSAHPLSWAMLQENLAVLRLDMAAAGADADAARAHRRAALLHIENALQVYDPVHSAPDHATATALRADILAALGP